VPEEFGLLSVNALDVLRGIALDSAAPSESATASQKKPSRIGLFAPFLILIVLFGGWSLYWLFISHDIARRLETAEADFKKGGYAISHKPVSVKGYPFRMFIEIQDFKAVSPSGRGLSIPLVSAEANAYALDKWVFVAGHGFTWHRGMGSKGPLGDVRVLADAKGSAIRASVSHMRRPVPDVAIEFINPVFVSTNKAHPFGLTSADRFEAYWRPTAKVAGSADFLWRVDGGKGYLRDAPVIDGKAAKFDWHLEGHMNNVASFKGGDLTDRFKNWRNSGGTMTELKASLGVGEVSLFMQSPALGLDADNTLRGQFAAEIIGHGDSYAFLKSAKIISPEAEALARPLWKLPALNPEKPLKLTLDLKEGGIYAGPLRISDAPVMP
jgi:hypothetical protein